MFNNICLEDFHVICRICLKFSDSLIPIASDQILKMMRACSTAEVQINDELPNNLCNICLNRLNISFDFKTLSEQSYKYLKSIVEDKKVANFHLSNGSSSEKVKNADFPLPNIEFSNENESLKKEKVQNETDAEDQNAVPSLTHVDIKEEPVFSIKEEIPSEAKTETTQPELNVPHDIHKSKSTLELLLRKEGKVKTKCPVCSKIFDCPSKLRRHSVVHLSDRPYKCPICGSGFKLNSKLLYHMKIIHSNSSRVTCDVCGKNILKTHLPRHLKIHETNRDKIKCDSCDKEFLHSGSLKLHMRRDHEKIGCALNYLCTICGKKYESRVRLERHSVVHKSDRPYQCSECTKSFKLDFALTKHIRTVHAMTKVKVHVPCEICHKLISKPNIQTHMKVHTQARNVLKCEQCSKEFLHKTSLKNHVLRDHEKVARELKHLCNICGRGTGSRAELEAHLVSHTDDKPYECEKCGSQYKSRHGLVHHVNTTHLNIKRHSCSVCLRKFSLRTMLVNHMRTHTGERPFSCVICGKSFSQKSSLGTHMKLVHSCTQKKVE